MKRAEAVRAALVRRGIESSHITVKAEGEQNPVASNDTQAGRRENRRSEIIIPGMEVSTAVGSSEGSTSATSSGGQGEQEGEQRSEQNGEQGGEQQRDREREPQREQKGEQQDEHPDEHQGLQSGDGQCGQ
jgi:hypothetical protein